MNTIGSRISEFAIKVYRNKKTFAERMGMLPQQLNAYIQGERSPSYEILEKFFNTGMSIDWLISGEGDMCNGKIKNADTETIQDNVAGIEVSETQRVQILGESELRKLVKEIIAEEIK